MFRSVSLIALGLGLAGCATSSTTEQTPDQITAHQAVISQCELPAATRLTGLTYGAWRWAEVRLVGEQGPMIAHYDFRAEEASCPDEDTARAFTPLIPQPNSSAEIKSCLRHVRLEWEDAPQLIHGEFNCDTGAAYFIRSNRVIECSVEMSPETKTRGTWRAACGELTATGDYVGNVGEGEDVSGRRLIAEFSYRPFKPVRTAFNYPDNRNPKLANLDLLPREQARLKVAEKRYEKEIDEAEKENRPANYADLFLDLADATPNRSFSDKIYYLVNAAKSLRGEKRMDEAGLALVRALKLAEQRVAADDLMVADIFYQLADHSRRTGKIRKARAFNTRALAIHKTRPDVSTIAQATVNYQAAIINHGENPSAALRSIQKVLALTKGMETDEPKLIGLSSVFEVYLLNRLDQQRLTLRQGTRSLERLTRYPQEYVTFIPRITLEVGFAHLFMDDLETAEDIADRTLPLEDDGSNILHARAQQLKGMIMRERNDPGADTRLEMALRLVRDAYGEKNWLVREIQQLLNWEQGS